MATAYEQGYAAALSVVADTIDAVHGGWKTRDEALLALEEYLEGRGVVRRWVGA